MRVKCIKNMISEIREAKIRDRLRQSIHREGPMYDLLIGGSYAVQALATWNDGGLRYYLHTIPESEHPYPYPAEMFEVTDASIPAGWGVQLQKSTDGVAVKLITFMEWATDATFYERLLDGDEETVREYYRLMLK